MLVFALELVFGRTWVSGKCKMEGKLMGVSADQTVASIQRDNGTIVKVPVSRLSKAD